MNQNTINVVEATPEVVNALKILKQRTPTMNENSSTKPFGSNGGVNLNPTGNAESKITGPFDVQLTYLEEDGEMVPYIQILDSSVQNATYAGYVYYQNTIKNILPGVLAPSQGWLYLEIDLVNNTAIYNIAATVPSYSYVYQKWAYALAYISATDGAYSIRRVHVPGNIIMPTLVEPYKGYFKLSAHAETNDNNETSYYVDCSDGYFFINGVLRSCPSAQISFPSHSYHSLIYLHYHQTVADNGGVESYSATIDIMNSSPGTSLNASDTDAYYIIGAVRRVNGNIDIIQQSYGVPTLFTFTSEC